MGSSPVATIRLTKLAVSYSDGRLRLKSDGTRAETRFRLSAKRTSPFKSAGASVQSTTVSRGVRISGSNVGYTMFRGTGYPFHSPVSLSLSLPRVTVSHHISTGLYRVKKVSYLRWGRSMAYSCNTGACCGGGTELCSCRGYSWGIQGIGIHSHTSSRVG